MNVKKAIEEIKIQKLWLELQVTLSILELKKNKKSPAMTYFRMEEIHTIIGADSFHF